MKTVCVQTGNSDNKLTQTQWANFVQDLKFSVKDFGIHFSGGSNCEEPWQNYCIVFEIDEKALSLLKVEWETLRKQYNQDSLAVLIGETVFL